MGQYEMFINIGVIGHQMEYNIKVLMIEIKNMGIVRYRDGGLWLCDRLICDVIN